MAYTVVHVPAHLHPVLSNEPLPLRLTPNKPEQRHNLIISRLRAEKTAQFLEVAPPPSALLSITEANAHWQSHSSIWELATRVHSEPFMTFLRSAYDEWITSNSFDPDHSEGGEMTGPLARLVPYHFSVKDGITKPGPLPQNKVAFYGCDNVTPLGADTRPALECDLAVLQSAVEQTKQGNKVYCANVHPGHHAYTENYGGFCYINLAALACALLLEETLVDTVASAIASNSETETAVSSFARSAKDAQVQSYTTDRDAFKNRKVFRRVLHIDLDYHHGNGSSSIHRLRHQSTPTVVVRQSDREEESGQKRSRLEAEGSQSASETHSPGIAAQNNRVLFISLHVDPAIDYPDNTGHACQSTDYDINFPLSKGTTGSAYLSVLDHALSVHAQPFQPEAVVVSLGVDGLAGDPGASPSAGFALTPADYASMGSRLAALGLPVLVVQEGGYKLEEVATAVAAFMQGLSSA